MSDLKIIELKQNMVAIGRLMWEKDLVSGLNGNISTRIDDESILITAHGSCLGFLSEKGILRLGLDGTVLEEGHVSTEKLMHTEIYKNFPNAKAVVHTHTTYTNAYFLENETLDPRVFESKMTLGHVEAVPQFTPAVTDAKPVIAAMKNNNIVVLKNHGVVAMGENLFDCFLLIQALEDSVKVDAISRLYANRQSSGASSTKKEKAGSANGKYKLFSQEQISKIVELVNADKQLAELGEKTNMTFDLAVKLNETGQAYRFSFQKGKIGSVGHDEKAEFVVSAPESVWRQVFNRQIDPFVATTQKKMHLQGDFAKISKWYAPCSRVFEIWAQIPVE